MLTDLSVVDFLKRTSEGNAVPGGGSVAALCAGLAAALVTMVANLTLGKKGYESVAAEMEAVRESAARLKEKCVRAVDADAAAYTRVMQALALPKQTPSEKEKRRESLEEGFKEAARAPLEAAEDALALLDLAGTAVMLGNRNAATDATVGVLAALAAVQGALYNVKTNLPSIRDMDFVAACRAKVAWIEAESKARGARILALVDTKVAE